MRAAHRSYDKSMCVCMPKSVAQSVLGRIALATLKHISIEWLLKPNFMRNNQFLPPPPPLTLIPSIFSRKRQYWLLFFTIIVIIGQKLPPIFSTHCCCYSWTDIIFFIVFITIFRNIFSKPHTNWYFLLPPNNFLLLHTSISDPLSAREVISALVVKGTLRRLPHRRKLTHIIIVIIGFSFSVSGKTFTKTTLYRCNINADSISKSIRCGGAG